MFSLTETFCHFTCLFLQQTALKDVTPTLAVVEDGLHGAAPVNVEAGGG